MTFAEGRRRTAAPTVPSRQLTAGRRAVGVLFMINAVAYANLVPRLPAIKHDLGLSNTSLGTAIAAVPLAALVAGPAAGWLIARFGSGRLAAWCGVGFGVVLPAVAVAPTWGALAATFLALGALDAVMDVAMNAHALRVQRGYERSIINGLHGFWSVGAVFGGFVGALAVGVDVSLDAQLAASGVVIVLAALSARRWLLPGLDPVASGPAPGSPAPGRRRSGVPRVVVLLGLLLVLSAVVEDAPSSWGAVLLRDELGTSAAVAGSVFLAFQGAMTVSRLVGDRVVDRVGEVAVLRAGGLLTAAGVGAGLLIGEPVAVVVGFALAGVGTASLYPLVFQAAGDLPGVATGHGVAAVAWMGRVGFLAAPPLVGLVGDAVGLRVGLAIVPIAGVLVMLLAGVLGRPSTAGGGG